MFYRPDGDRLAVNNQAGQRYLFCLSFFKGMVWKALF